MSEESKQITDVNELIAQRRHKLKKLREQGEVYPNHFHRHHFANTLHQQFEKITESELTASPVTVKLAGRLMTRRLMGKASFFHLQDMTGRIQVYLRQDEMSLEKYQAFLHWDLGDIVGVEGILFRTKTGELSIRAKDIILLSKSLRPLPDKYHGLVDQEMCYRQRYLDLMINEKTRKVFILREKIIDTIRAFLKARDFIEVETPMMQILPGGAAARPFVTHHNALNLPLYLRIAPELYLKRLVVGGFENVFEINRNFRNEGLSTRHNPEFTMLEFYQAYADYQDLMNLTENLLMHLTQTVMKSSKIIYQNQEINFENSFQRLTLFDAILKFNPRMDADELKTQRGAEKIAQSLEIPVHKKWGLGKLQLEIFEKTVEHQLIQPTFIMGYPAEVSPLARRSDANPFLTDRFELFMGGREIANGFSELNDPDDQADRFRQQLLYKEMGDEEAMPFDEDYITALEYGMPPTAGEGIGIDRLIMLFADVPSIRDVILFPHMRPEK